MTNALLKSRLNNLKDSGFFKNLIIKRGIEKEFFRIDKRDVYLKNLIQKLWGLLLQINL